MSVGGGRRPLHALLVDAHAVSGRGLLTATALGVEALGRIVPGLDPRIDIGHAMTALGAPGVLAGVTASAAASGGIACPASTAAGAATFCAATVTPAGAGVFACCSRCCSWRVW